MRLVSWSERTVCDNTQKVPDRATNAPECAAPLATQAECMQHQRNCTLAIWAAGPWTSMQWLSVPWSATANTRHRPPACCLPVTCAPPTHSTAHPPTWAGAAAVLPKVGKLLDCLGLQSRPAWCPCRGQTPRVPPRSRPPKQLSSQTDGGRHEVWKPAHTHTHTPAHTHTHTSHAALQPATAPCHANREQGSIRRCHFEKKKVRSNYVSVSQVQQAQQAQVHAGVA